MPLLLQSRASKGVGFEMEMLEAEYSFVADKVARMQAQVSFLIKENYKAIMTLFEGIYY